MKILHLIPYMHPSAGGPPVVVDRWCAQQRAVGIEASVLTTDAYADQTGDTGWIDHYRQQYPIEVASLTGPRGFGFSRALRGEIDKQLGQVDLVHVHNLWGYTNLLAARRCPAAGVPFVVSTHGMLDPHSLARKAWKKRAYGRIVEWPAARRASAIIFTHPEEERLARLSAASLPPGFIVPLGTETPPTEDRSLLAGEFLNRYPQLAGKTILLFLGRLHSKKGLDLLLPAFAELAGKAPEAHLVLVGPGEPEYVEELRRRVHRLRIGDRVSFTGPLGGRDKWGAFAAAHVFVLPSYQENFAISVVEALRMGTPAVVSERVNIWQDLVAGGAAVRCDLDAASISRTLGELLSSPERREVLGRNGRQLAVDHYSWELSAERLTAVYEAVLGRRAATASAVR